MGFIHAFSQRRWPGGRVPYVINTVDFPEGSTERQNILASIQSWNNLTMIHFFPRNGHVDYVEFLATSGTNVSSSNGRAGGRQTIRLNSTTMNTIFHEISHSVGLLHEHQRPDRNQYVIVKNSVIEDNQYNIVRELGIPISNYDCGSRMHYNEGVNLNIISHDCEQLAENNNGLSDGDLNALAHLYYKRINLISRSPNCIDLIVRGVDGSVYYKNWNGDEWSPSLNGNGFSLDGIVIETPSLVSHSFNQVDVFARGQDWAVYHKLGLDVGTQISWPPSQGSNWERIGGTVLCTPAVISMGIDRMDLFAQGTDRAVYHKWWAGTQWLPNGIGGEWQRLGGTVLETPTVVSWGLDRIDLFARGRDRSIYHKWWNGVEWGPSTDGEWQRMGGIATSAPSVVSWGNNRIDIFVRGEDGAMYHKWWNGNQWRPNGVDGEWERLGGDFIGTPSVVSWGENRIDCFVTGRDGAMYHKWWNGKQWRPSMEGEWEKLGGICTSTPSVVSWGENRIDCFVSGTEGAMYHKWWDGSQWRPTKNGLWQEMGGSVA